MQEKIEKWYTIVKHVDTQTGEIITKAEAENNYIKGKKHKHVTYTEHINERTRNKYKNGIITWTIECNREGKQIKIFD